MAGKIRPICEKCGTKMVSMCARLGNGPEDDRPTSKKSYRHVGWMCKTCTAMTRSPMPATWDFPTPLL